jgi:hypothetical protein
VRVHVPAAGARAGYSFAAPAPLRQDVPASERGAVTVPVGRGTLLLVVFPDGPADPVRALDRLRAKLDRPVGPARTTRIGGLPAAVADVDFGSRVLREYRYVRDGVLYGGGIMMDAGDAVAADTGVAVLASIRWDE